MQALSNGIIMDAHTASSFQKDRIYFHLKKSKQERDYSKKQYLTHMLENNINVPSNKMISKAGQFFNFRNYGYQTIYQQNKESLESALDKIDDHKREQQNLLNSLQSLARKKSPEQLLVEDEEKNDRDKKSFNSKCLQFKKEKAKQIQENQKNTQSQSSPWFLKQGREFARESSEENCCFKYSPVYSQVKPSVQAHKFLPIPQTQRREEIIAQPDCIVRGNLCEYQIRKITSELKGYADKIQQALYNLEEVERKINELQEEKQPKADQTKLRAKLEKLFETKRGLGEQILELQRCFIQIRTQYEFKVNDNIDLLEMNLFNYLPQQQSEEKPQIVQFNKLAPRGELFAQNQQTEDLTERLFNNYQMSSTKNLQQIQFQKMKHRDPLFKIKQGPQCYDNSFRSQSPKSFVNMQKQSSKDKLQNSLEQQQEKTIIDWRRVVRAKEYLSQRCSSSGRGVIEMNKNIPREQHSHNNL